MPGLFGWGEKDDTTPAERKAWKERAKQGMRDQKQAAKAAKAAGKQDNPRTGKDEAPRHASRKGSLGW